MDSSPFLVSCMVSKCGPGTTFLNCSLIFPVVLDCIVHWIPSHASYCIDRVLQHTIQYMDKHVEPHLLICGITAKWTCLGSTGPESVRPREVTARGHGARSRREVTARGHSARTQLPMSIVRYSRQRSADSVTAEVKPPLTSTSAHPCFHGQTETLNI